MRDGVMSKANIETTAEILEYLEMADKLARSDWNHLTMQEVQTLFLQFQRQKYMTMGRGDLRDLYMDTFNWDDPKPDGESA